MDSFSQFNSIQSIELILSEKSFFYRKFVRKNLAITKIVTINDSLTTSSCVKKSKIYWENIFSSKNYLQFINDTINSALNKKKKTAVFTRKRCEHNMYNSE